VTFFLRRFSIVEFSFYDYFEMSIKEDLRWRWTTVEQHIDYPKQERKVTDDFPEGIGWRDGKEG
jgi:hypothetical protein